MWDLTVIIIAFELAIGFVAGIGLFEHTYYTPSQSNSKELNGYLHGTSNATNTLIESTKTTNSDYFSLGTYLFGALNIFLNIVGAVVFFYPHLVNTFMVPMALAAPIQCLIYITYAWGIVQFMSGRSGSLMQ